MAKLTDIVNQKTEDDQILAAGHLINTAENLNTQYNNTIAEISTLKIKIKTDIDNNNWIGVDIDTLGQKLHLANGIRQKCVLIKNQFNTVKIALKNQEHILEIQSAINNLDIPA